VNEQLAGVVVNCEKQLDATFRVFPTVVEVWVTVAVPVDEKVGTAVDKTAQASVEPAMLWVKDWFRTETDVKQVG
jgi:hypothetical protein